MFLKNRDRFLSLHYKTHDLCGLEFIALHNKTQDQQELCGLEFFASHHKTHDPSFCLMFGQITWIF